MQANPLYTAWRPAHRMLIVADRTTDPQALVDALRGQAREQRIVATLLVPASLHGRATIPAAEHFAALLQTALLNAGLAVCDARVGDPDPHAAIDDALLEDAFDEVLINVRSPRLTRALHLGLADRVGPDSAAVVTDRRPGRWGRGRPPVARTA
jgi:hypothetical protein